MAYSIEWQVPKRAVKVTYHGTITVEDLQGVNEDLDRYQAEGIGPIHVISCLETEKFPMDLKVVRPLLSTLNQDIWGWFIVVGFESSLGRFFMVLVTNAFKVQAKAVSSVEEALEVLHRVDPTLEGESEPTSS